MRPVPCYFADAVRKTLAVILILAGVAVLVYLGRPHGAPGSVDERTIVQHQRAQVLKIERGETLDKCGGTLIKFLGHTQPVAEGVSQRVLDSGVVGHFPHTGPVGIGNYALTGHVVTHGEPFRYMPNLAKGDKVKIIKCGVTYTFSVDRKWNVYYTDVSVLKPLPKTLTLITCASRFVHTDYRTVVRGHLVRA